MSRCIQCRKYRTDITSLQGGLVRMARRASRRNREDYQAEALELKRQRDAAKADFAAHLRDAHGEEQSAVVDS